MVEKVYPIQSQERLFLTVLVVVVLMVTAILKLATTVQRKSVHLVEEPVVAQGALVNHFTKVLLL
jgi:hypothetical protein